MSAQAGWYESPGEPGTLRYWGGESWTEHRQPTPTGAPVAAVTSAPMPTLVLTPTMAPAVALTPTSQPPVALIPTSAPPVVATSTPWQDPYAQNSVGSPFQAALAGSPATRSQPGFFHNNVGIRLNVDGIQVGPGALSQLAELSDMKSVFQTKMQEAQANARVQPRSTALKGALSGMVVGIVMILLGAALVLFFSGQQNPQDGEAQTQGTVVGHSGFGSACQPEVGYTVAGKTYTVVGDTIGGTCAEDHVGDSANVIYSVANPSKSRADFGNPLGFVDVGLPILGVVVFFSSLAALVARLVRRRRQVATV